LKNFWTHHDPTTMNRQGADIGSQYRSAIFYHNEDQQKLAEVSKVEYAKQFESSIVTNITPAVEFYEAEEYHQRYFEKHPNAACTMHKK